MRSVSVKQTKDQIADIIREDIISGSLKGGDELTQEKLAEQTGLSRMPVREALQTLEQEGFLVRLPNRHMRVCEITSQNIRQYFTSLADLELSFCFQLFKEKLNTDEIVELLKEELKSNSLMGEYKLHLALSASLCNEYLANMHKKWASSFYKFSLKQNFRENAAANSLAELLDGITNSDISTVSGGLNNYFRHYKKFLIKGSE